MPSSICCNASLNVSCMLFNGWSHSSHEKFTFLLLALGSTGPRNPSSPPSSSPVCPLPQTYESLFGPDSIILLFVPSPNPSHPTPPLTNPPTQNKQYIHELELEILRPELIMSLAAKRGDPNANEVERSGFNELIRVFVNNARILVKNACPP